MRLSTLALALSVLCLSATAARADTFTTFDFNGSYAYTEFNGYTPGPVLGNYPLNGTITYDNTTGSVSSVSGFLVTLPDGSSWQPWKSFDSFGDSYLTIIEGSFHAVHPIFDVTIPNAALASGAGGSICSNFGDCYDGGVYGSPQSEIQLNSWQGYTVYGTLTPATAPTPEPSSIALLLTGLAGVATRIRRRA